MDPFQTALQALTDCGRGEVRGGGKHRERARRATCAGGRGSAIARALLATSKSRGGASRAQLGGARRASFGLSALGAPDAFTLRVSYTRVSRSLRAAPRVPMRPQEADRASRPALRAQMTGKSDTREYTINLHKALHKRHLTFKKRAPRAVKVIQEFAKKVVSGQAAEPRLLVVWDVLARRTRRAAPAAGRRRWAGGAQGEARPLASRRRAPRRPSSTSLSTGPSGRTASR